MAYLNRIISTTNSKAEKKSKKFDYTVKDMSHDDVAKCYTFAREMVYGKGYHRAESFGKGDKRSKKEIFINTFQGKLGEVEVYNYFENKKGYSSEKLDFSVMGKDLWDEFDLIFYKGERKLSAQIKSTKHFGQLLLLESHNWNDMGEYIPNLKMGTTAIYDYFIMTRVKQNNPVSLSEKDIIDQTIKVNDFINSGWKIEISGVLSSKDFVDKIIKYKYILPKGYMLGNTVLKVDNYYCQCDDLDEIEII